MSLIVPDITAHPVTPPLDAAPRVARASTAQRFAGAAAWSLVLRVAGTGAMFLAQLVLARWLGAVHFGEYVLVVSWVSILAIIAKGGWEAGSLKFVAEYSSTAQAALLAGFRSTRLRRAALTTVAVALIAALGWPYVVPERFTQPYLLGLLLAAVPLLALSDLASADLRARQRVLWADLPVLVIRPLLTVALFAAALGIGWGAANSTTAIVAFLVASLLAYLVLQCSVESAAVRREAAPAHDLARWRAVLGPLWWITLCNLVLQQTDIVLIGLFVDAPSAGVYSAAARISRVIPLGLTAINAVGSPLLAEQFAMADRAGLQRLTRLMAWGSLLVTLPAALVAVVLGPWLLQLFGGEFTMGYLPLVVLVVGQVMNGLTGSVAQLMTMTGQQSLSARVLTLFAALQLALSCWLIPWMGIAGAALATTVTLVGWNLTLACLVWRNLGINPTVFGCWPRRARPHADAAQPLETA